MRLVKWWVYFDSKAESTKFKNLIRESKSDIAAISKITTEFPELDLEQARCLVDNFKKEINTKP